ncbi:MAG: hypothetical protein U9Q37_04395 [Euryarchaeota archaeon]|nr:hypothetical protein [Euryarchaeota archaeon]
MVKLAITKVAVYAGDEYIIEECIKRGTIKIVDPASKFTGFESEIHAAERDVMALAGECRCIAIIDDGS